LSNQHSIIVNGYLPGYYGNPRYGFTRQFPWRINVCFDNVNANPQADFNVLVQCEPPELYQAFAGMVKEAYHKFDLILSYDNRILELPNAQEFCPVGSWINPDIVLDKQDQITYLMSSKIYTNAQRMRFVIMRRYGHVKHIGPFEFFMHRSPPRVPSKEPFYVRAKFNIACENQIIPNMYTEKLLDCFVTRTVPIYYGCTNLERYFDTRGVIQFWTIEQLEHILATLTPDDYESRLPYIEANYQRARPFWEHNAFQRIENVIAQHLGL
jgi:hypothetical protein